MRNHFRPAPDLPWSELREYTAQLIALDTPWAEVLRRFPAIQRDTLVYWSYDPEFRASVVAYKRAFAREFLGDIIRVIRHRIQDGETATLNVWFPSALMELVRICKIATEPSSPREQSALSTDGDPTGKPTV